MLRPLLVTGLWTSIDLKKQNVFLLNHTRIENPHRVRKKTFCFLRSIEVHRPVTRRGEASPRKIVVPTGNICWMYFETIGHSLKNCPPLRKIFSPPGVPNWLRAWKSSKCLVFLLPCWDIIKCLNASRLTTAVFELMQQFYHAAEIANVANAVSACADQP